MMLGLPVTHPTVSGLRHTVENISSALSCVSREAGGAQLCPVTSHPPNVQCKATLMCYLDNPP